MSLAPPTTTSPRNRSVVRVGVRVRPFTSKEIGNGGISKSVVSCHGNREIRLGSDRRFTFDSVFDERTPQEDLYRSVAPPLLESFLDGYNATIMAYGQTGSGKTFTMGSEAHADIGISENTGMIPRFMNDLFISLQQKQEASSSMQSAEAASRRGIFLNIGNTTTSNSLKYRIEASFLEVYGEDVHDLLQPTRPSIPIREDANGGVICSGLSQKTVLTAQAALQVLHEGTLNRTTAATLMNLTSSRSHAVFAVTLHQSWTDGDGVEVCVTSRFTFVDLAGSERMKKTGAEGERAREGIKINEGLLALGNVINALADDKRDGRKPHVPYRQSKLTRLLQDALGGNSQTLFLACVSPSALNASETLSTLRYANRARDIKNAPVQNVDATALELQKLRSWSSVLQAELLRLKFLPEKKDDSHNHASDEIDLLLREDVKEYLFKLSHIAESKQGISTVSTEVQAGIVVSQLTPDLRDLAPTEAFSSIDNPQVGKFHSLDGVNPDDDMDILNHLLELQQRDQAFTDTQKEDHEKLKEVDGMLEREQALLLKLRDNLKVYQNLKSKYEMLMAQVQQLETEKSELSVKLGHANDDPSQGCSTTIRRNMETVDRSLSRLRHEVQDHRKKCRLLEKEVQNCQALERRIADLKADRTAMIRKQKEAGQRHREYTESKQREIAALKKKEQKTTQQMSKLEKEVEMHKKNLEKRQIYITKLTGKLEETRSHLSKLLSIRQRDLKRTGGQRRLTITMLPPPKSKDCAFAGSTEEVESAVGLLRRSINERVRKACLENEYQHQVAEYSAAMRSMATAVECLRHASDQGGAVEEDLQQSVLDMELKAELLGSNLKDLERQLADEDGKDSDAESLIKDVVESKDSPVLRSVLLEVLELYGSCELQNRETAEVLDRKQKAAESLEQEVDLLNQRIEDMSSNLARAKATDHTTALASSTAIHELQRSVEKLNFEKSRCLMEYTEAKEKLSLLEANSSLQGQVDQSQLMLEELHSILRDIGRYESAEDLSDSIKHSVQDTLERMIAQAKTQRSNMQSATDTVTSKVSQLALRLGLKVPNVPDDETLDNRLKQLKSLEAELKAEFDNAISRRDNMQTELEHVMVALGIQVEDLAPQLQQLIEDLPLDSANITSSFLNYCQKQLKTLHIKKSELLAQNSLRYDEVKALVKSAVLKPSQTLKFVERHCRTMPPWWDKSIAGELAKSLSSDVSGVKITDPYTLHLSLIHSSLEHMLACRRDLSRALKGLVELTQKKLLDTVDSESETVEAYSSFHEALFLLPELSKERINTCLSEIASLADCVEAMVLSELEALTVVWEALNISGADRGAFWERVERLEQEGNSKGAKDFVAIVESAGTDAEKWVLKSAKDAQTKAAALQSKLLKLDAVHKEVEKLRTRQDAKSRILTLDSEVRVLNAQLIDFEIRKCNKTRLLSRQTGSAHLLKEERYRKQMKAKFSRKMEQLAELLKGWLDEEGSIFDANLLSEDVRKLLENSHQMGSWIEQRKEFMHLRTVTTERRKRRLDSSDSTESGDSDSNNQSRAKRSKDSTKVENTIAPQTRPAFDKESSGQPENQRESKKPFPALIESLVKKRSSPASIESDRPTKRASPSSTLHSVLSNQKRSASPQEPLQRRSPSALPLPRPPLSPNPSSSMHAPIQRPTRSKNNIRKLSHKPVSPLSLPLTMSSLAEKLKDPSSSLKPPSPARSYGMNTNSGVIHATMKQPPTVGSNSRKPLSTKHSSSSNQEHQADGGNKRDTSKRITRSASAAAQKKLVLPPFAHVLEKAFSPMKVSKENLNLMSARERD